jgi:lipopolysaccharide/colanic/teichoic acid biosynthesis glycosyltransferase
VPRLLKRAFDVSAALLIVGILSPLLLLIAAVIKCTSPGPVLFRQARLGLRLRPFTMLKFRTMVADADARREEVVHLNDARGSAFKIRQDPRVTKFGRLLRRTSLDELPQLLNVIRGEMSLVGPRPLPDWLVQGLSREIDPRRLLHRFAVLPGMSGRWQVRGRIQDSQALLEEDLHYVDNWSLWLDLQILAATPAAILQEDRSTAQRG